VRVHRYSMQTTFGNETRCGCYNIVMKTCLFILASLALTTAVAAQSVVDPNLAVQTWTSGLDNPTGFAFLNTRGDMMVIEKNTGKVQLVRDRKVRRTLLDLPVSNDSERGLLGIATLGSPASGGFVYLYHTAAAVDGGAPISNKISRYRYDGEQLVFDRKIIDLPALTGPNHNGGKILFDARSQLYVATGDLNLNNATANYGGREVQLTGAILRMDSTGKPSAGNPFRVDSSRNNPANYIYAYGVRNTFGIAIEPVTGDLWDTENGAQSFDEINRVFKGFNSGWERIMGPVSRNGGTLPELNSLGPAALYDDPKFSWLSPVAPTDLEFFPTARLGSQYKNDLFVGTTRGGKILRFDLTGSRKSLSLAGGLADGVADNSSGNRFAEQDAILFGNDFGLVSDLTVGPGGLYVTDFLNGRIFRITTAAPSTQMQPIEAAGRGSVPEPGSVMMIVGGALLLGGARGYSRRRLSPTPARHGHAGTESHR